jgi:hypothetical protein
VFLWKYEWRKSKEQRREVGELSEERVRERYGKGRLIAEVYPCLLSSRLDRVGFALRVPSMVEFVLGVDCPSLLCYLFPRLSFQKCLYCPFSYPWVSIIRISQS